MWTRTLLSVPGEVPVSAGLVWFHGGGWVGGELDWPEASGVADGLNARGVFTVARTYRKAVDGVRFPAPLDDVVDAFLEHAADDRDWFIGGASAGANLAAGATLRLRDEGRRMPVGVVLAYPLLHPELPPMSAELEATLAGMPADGWTFTPEMARGFTSNYEPTLSDPYAFPALANLEGFPPTFMPTAEFDTLRASSDAFSEYLPDVTEMIIGGTYHGFLNEPRRDAMPMALDAIAEWILTGPCAR